MIISLFSMPLRCLRMMGSFFMISFCCTLGSIAMMLGCFFMMLCGILVILSWHTLEFLKFLIV